DDEVAVWVLSLQLSLDGQVSLVRHGRDLKVGFKEVAVPRLDRVPIDAGRLNALPFDCHGSGRGLIQCQLKLALAVTPLERGSVVQSQLELLTQVGFNALPFDCHGSGRAVQTQLKLAMAVPPLE